MKRYTENYYSTKSLINRVEILFAKQKPDRKNTHLIETKIDEFIQVVLERIHKLEIAYTDAFNDQKNIFNMTKSDLDKASKKISELTLERDIHKAQNVSLEEQLLSNKQGENLEKLLKDIHYYKSKSQSFEKLNKEKFKQIETYKKKLEEQESLNKDILQNSEDLSIKIKELSSELEELKNTSQNTEGFDF